MENKSNSSNTFLAIALSIMVILGWQYFYMGPKIERERVAAENLAKEEKARAIANGTAPAAGTATSVPNPDGSKPSAAQLPSAQVPVTAEMDRAAALAQDKRIEIETDKVIGSINLKGARIDDVRLKSYHESVDKSSPLIVLLSPAQAKNGYFAEFGYAPGPNAGKMPDATTDWTVQGNSKLDASSPVMLTFTNEKNVTFKRKIEIDENYMFTMSDTIENQSGEAITAYPYGRVVRYEKPDVAGITYISHEGLVGFLGEATLQEISYEDVEAERQIKPIETADSGWLGITDKYWGTALIPSGAFKPRFSYFTDGRTRFQSDYLSDAVIISAGSNAMVTSRFFGGAKKSELINEYKDAFNINGFEKIIDWGWFHFITRPMAWTINKLNILVGNFGIAILLITVLVKAIFFPLANLSYASMAKMKKLQPEMTRLREVYGEDKVKQQQEMMALYKKEKINPAAGCWPILIQIPVFFALYKVLYVSIEMRHAPFFGWIQDLSAPDPTSIFNLFGLLPFDVPGFLLIGIWPLIMGITMFLQMKMNPAPPDPTQQMIFTWMPVIFTFMLATFPAGLVIYWAWNNTLSIIQQGTIMRRHDVKIELWDNLKSLFGKKKDTPAE